MHRETNPLCVVIFITFEIENELRALPSVNGILSQWSFSRIVKEPNLRYKNLYFNENINDSSNRIYYLFNKRN